MSHGKRSRSSSSRSEKPRLKAPFITREEAERFAEGFLTQYHPSRQLPIPIDLLAETAYGLDIAPCTGIEDVVDGHGYLSADLTTIYVDRRVYEHKVPYRYRSTVAHELGHRIMHAEVYEGLQFDSLEEYVEFTQSVDEEDIGWFETHANWFMGYVLVPTTQLRQLVEEKHSKWVDAGSDVNVPATAVSHRLISSLAQEFQVSRDLIKTRLRQEGLGAQAFLD